MALTTYLTDIEIQGLAKSLVDITNITDNKHLVTKEYVDTKTSIQTGTYEDITNLVLNNELVPGKRYIVDNYKSTYIIHNSDDIEVLDDNGKTITKPGGVLNTDVHDGTPYGGMSSIENPPPATERILLLAITENLFSHISYSLTYLGEELVYDFFDNSLDVGGNIIERKGWISKRSNHEHLIVVNEDYRHFRGNRRWKVDLTDPELVGAFPFNHKVDTGRTTPDYAYSSLYPGYATGKRISLFDTTNVVSGSLKKSRNTTAYHMITEEQRAPLTILDVKDFKDYTILDYKDDGNYYDINITSDYLVNNVIHGPNGVHGIIFTSGGFYNNTFRGKFSKIDITGHNCSFNCLMSGDYYNMELGGTFRGNLSFEYTGTIHTSNATVMSSNLLYASQWGDISVLSGSLYACNVTRGAFIDSAITLTARTVDSMFQGIITFAYVNYDRFNTRFNSSVMNSYFIGKDSRTQVDQEGKMGGFVDTVFNGKVLNSKLHLSSLGSVFNGKLHSVNWEGSLDYFSINTSVIDHETSGLDISYGVMSNSHPLGGLITVEIVEDYNGIIANLLISSDSNISSNISYESYLTNTTRTQLLTNGFTYISGLEDNVIVMYDYGGVDGNDSIITDTNPIGAHQAAGTNITYEVRYRLPGANTIIRDINIDKT